MRLLKKSPCFRKFSFIFRGRDK